MDDAEKTLLASAFQILAVAAGKARLPIVDGVERRKAYTGQQIVSNDRICRSNDELSTWQYQLPFLQRLPYSNTESK